MRWCVPVWWWLSALLVAAEFPPVSRLPAPETPRPNVQRTMRLLAESTAEHRHTVRLLFYGQSITEQGWWKLVVDDLRRRFPHAHLVAENRAIGGHSSQRLVKTMEADVTEFYPDLMIFHVYGAHNTYEDILRQTRQWTTSEILQQNDHVVVPADLTEETAAEKLPIQSGNWNGFMNHHWLPEMSRRYGTEFCDQRQIWKNYLQDHQLPPAALLSDAVHLNPHGEWLMAQGVMAHLQVQPQRSAAEGWVTTYEVGKDLHWEGDRLTLEFDGNRVVALGEAGGTLGAIRIDGEAPSTRSELYVPTRATSYPQLNWPCLLRVSTDAERQGEDWTLTIDECSDDCATIRFRVRGSRTGDDGAGDSKSAFVSRSGRVRLAPEDWNMAFGRQVTPQQAPPAAGFEVKWREVLQGADEVRLAAAPPGVRPECILASGLKNGRHRLEVTGGPATRLTAIRVHRPPIAAP